MKNAKNPLIFIVEGNHIYADLITGYLSEKKIRNLKVFANSTDCLNNMHLNPDVIVLDYSLEGMNGLELMHKIRSSKQPADFIFLSAQESVEMAVHLMKEGAFDYIVKNDKAPGKLVRAIIQATEQTKKDKLKKGFRVMTAGFFIILFIIILIVVALRYLLDW